MTIKTEEALIADGWEKRFVACEPRLSEMVDLYKEIGFEVHLEPLPSKEEAGIGNCEADACTACFNIERERYRTIFTKPVAGRK